MPRQVRILGHTTFDLQSRVQGPGPPSLTRSRSRCLFSSCLSASPGRVQALTGRAPTSLWNYPKSYFTLRYYVYFGSALLAHQNDEPGSPPAVGTSSHLPPHPPLPTSVPPTPTFPPPIITALCMDIPSSVEGVLSTPSYIVSRVFPHGRSGSNLLPPPPWTPTREPYS